MKSNYLSHKLLDLRFGAAAWTPPATVYLARFVAANWAASAVIALNAFVLANGRIFKCTTAGTTGSSTLTWPSTDGATVSDGGVVWTEQTTVINTGVPSGLECSSAAYARQPITNNSTNFPNASNKSKSLALAVSFAQETNTAGQTVAVGLFDSLSAGNLLDWAIVTTPKDFITGDACSFPANSIVFTEV